MSERFDGFSEAAFQCQFDDTFGICSFLCSTLRRWVLVIEKASATWECDLKASQDLLGELLP